jgi:AraC-like DNA-binding protein
MESETAALPEPSGIRLGSECLPRPLRPFIHEYYEEGVELAAGQTLRIPVCATAEPFLNVTLSGEAYVHLAGGFHLPPVTIAGPQPGPYMVEAAGALWGFYVHFRPVGALALLGVDDYSLVPGGARPLHEMVQPDLSAEARAWEDALLRAGSFEERVALADRFFLEQLRPISPVVAILEAAVAHIEDAHGNIRVDDLARRLGCSESSLRRYFRALGMSPKHYAQVVRFRHAHAYLSSTPGATWADVVHLFGYSDQPHFVREYRRFSGGPPSRWKPELRPIDRRMGIEKLPAAAG